MKRVGGKRERMECKSGKRSEGISGKGMWKGDRDRPFPSLAMQKKTFAAVTADGPGCPETSKLGNKCSLWDAEAFGIDQDTSKEETQLLELDTRRFKIVLLGQAIIIAHRC